MCTEIWGLFFLLLIQKDLVYHEGYSNKKLTSHPILLCINKAQIRYTSSPEKVKAQCEQI